MRTGSTIRRRRNEAGIALLISIFVLLLISVVAIALIVSSGTESALAGNYRSSTGVYYAAVAGLEEARGRLSSKDPNSFKTTWTTFYPAPNTALPIGTVGYVLNPGPTETAANILTTYPDTEYDSEFGSGALANATAAANVKTTSSVWTQSPLSTNLSFPPPLYKWVRINAVSEQSLNLADTYPFSDGTKDPTPLYYDGTHLTDVNCSSCQQVFEITALAVLPNGNAQNSQRLVQYLAAPVPITLPPFQAALTLSGSSGSGAVSFVPPTTHLGNVEKGNDQDCSGTLTGSLYAAIGVFDSSPSDVTNVKNSIPVSDQPNYTGRNPPPPPDVEDVSGYFTPNFTTQSQLDAIAQTVIQSADAVVPAGSASTQQTYLNSLGMSPSNPLTVVAQGDLDLTGWRNHGYGLLLVTGTLTYDPNDYWEGIILIIGAGILKGDHPGGGEIDGAVLIAKTQGGLGGATVQYTNNMGGEGIRYSACWIQKAIPSGAYKILSFHEIAQ